jgi:hypothetical protein
MARIRGLRDLTLALLKRRLGLVFASAPFGNFFGEEACDRQALLHLQVDKYSKGKRREFFLQNNYRVVSENYAYRTGH